MAAAPTQSRFFKLLSLVINLFLAAAPIRPSGGRPVAIGATARAVASELRVSLNCNRLVFLFGLLALADFSLIFTSYHAWFSA